MARYDIIAERSKVVIDARSSVHPIHTETDGLTGFVEIECSPEGRVDVDAGSRAHLSFPVEKLRSGNPLEDRELRRRIDAKKFPTIDGELTGLRTAPDGGVLVAGTITFRGVTLDVEHPMEFDRVDEQTIRATGEA